MKKILLSVALIASLSSTTLFAAEASKESIMAMLEKTGATKIMDAMFANTSRMLANDPEKQKEFNELIKTLDANEYFNNIIPIYQKYFTQEDISAMNKFYDTPTGKKTIKNLPKISVETMEVAQKWIIEAMQKVEKKSKK